MNGTSIKLTGMERNLTLAHLAVLAAFEGRYHMGELYSESILEALKRLAPELGFGPDSSVVEKTHLDSMVTTLSLRGFLGAKTIWRGGKQQAETDLTPLGQSALHKGMAMLKNLSFNLRLSLP